MDSGQNQPGYADRLYGLDGVSGRCTRCGVPADYLLRDPSQESWAAAAPWCLTCRPRRGRPPHHGERLIRAALHERSCSVSECSARATAAVTAAGDPHLSQLRRGPGQHDVVAIIGRADAFCDEHLPRRALGPARAAQEHPFADAQILRAAIEDPRAKSVTMIARLLGLRTGGSTRAALLRNHAAHRAKDPTYPPLPPTRSAAEWGASPWRRPEQRLR